MFNSWNSTIARALINEEKCRIASMARRRGLILSGHYRDCANLLRADS